MKPIVERIHTVYRHGISISAGFSLGFDNEKPGIRDAMIECIEETGIMVAMVGLLEVEMQIGIDFSHSIATYPLSTKGLPKAVQSLLPVVASTCGTDSN